MIQRWLPRNTHIYKFIESLKMHESIRSSDLHQVSIGLFKFERKHKIDKLREKKISYLTASLENGEISVAAFLEAMSGKDILPTLGISNSKYHNHHYYNSFFSVNVVYRKSRLRPRRTNHLSETVTKHGKRKSDESVTPLQKKRRTAPPKRTAKGMHYISPDIH